MNLALKQRNVLAIITKYPKAAEDEALLFERYWVEIDGWDESKSLYWNLTRVTRPETITRRRRELFNLGLITYSNEALEARTEAFKAEQEAYIQALNNFLGMNPNEELDRLTIRPTAPSGHNHAVSWLNG